MDAIKQHRGTITVSSLSHTNTYAHSHTLTHTHPSLCLCLSQASRLLPGLHLGVCPNSAVVVPEEFPRGGWGKRWGKETGRPRSRGPPCPLPSYWVSEKARNSACEDFPTLQRGQLLAEDEDRKTGTSELFFSFEGIKDFGEEKMKEPVHDSFTLLDDRKSESGEEERWKVERKREAGEGLNMEAACSGPGVRLDTLGS